MLNAFACRRIGLVKNCRRAWTKSIEEITSGAPMRSVVSTDLVASRTCWTRPLEVVGDGELGAATSITVHRQRTSPEGRARSSVPTPNWGVYVQHVAVGCRQRQVAEARARFDAAPSLNDGAAATSTIIEVGGELPRTDALPEIATMPAPIPMLFVHVLDTGARR